MFYRLAGQFKSSYAADQQIFPIRQDRTFIAGVLIVAFGVIPLVANDYWLGAILIPFLILALAALGLNILTGYTGQLSLGTAGFMAVGAFAAFNFILRVPGMPFLLPLPWPGSRRADRRRVRPAQRAHQGLLPRGRHARGAVLHRVGADQVRLVLQLQPIGVISAQAIEILGYASTPRSKYLLTLGIVARARGEEHGAHPDRALLDGGARHGPRRRGDRHRHRAHQAGRVRGELFYCGVAGALWAYAYLGAVEPQAFTLDRSFQVLFMIIIGGVGTVLGAFLGAAFIVLLPIALNVGAHAFFPASAPTSCPTSSS